MVRLRPALGVEENVHAVEINGKHIAVTTINRVNGEDKVR
jgi:hypothetical protein